MNDVRMAKFETLISDINLNIQMDKDNAFYGLGGLMGIYRRVKFCNGNTALALIYDYESCNDYAKIILDKSALCIITNGNMMVDSWKEKYPTYDVFNDVKKTIDASKEFVQFCRKKENISEGYKFIFWALMVLAVDRTDAENHLALICDFAKMLYITEEEFEDLIHIVKIIYKEEKFGEYKLVSEKVTSIFNKCFN